MAQHLMQACQVFAPNHLWSRAWAWLKNALILQVYMGTSPACARGMLTAEEQRTISLFRDNTPSVVFITNIATK